MTEEIQENPDKTGKEVERNEKGQYVEGHIPSSNAHRPKGSISITTKIKQMLEEIPEGEKMTRLEALLKRIFIMAINDGSEQMIKQIWAYVDGMPKQPIGIGFDEPIEKIKIEIIQKKDGDKPEEHNSIPEELAGV